MTPQAWWESGRNVATVVKLQIIYVIVGSCRKALGNIFIFKHPFVYVIAI
jgi:hypothetical protein